MWYLVSDDCVTALGNLGRHTENELLSLDHVALKNFGTLAICGITPRPWMPPSNASRELELVWLGAPGTHALPRRSFDHE
jgi:hypothetical protein